MKIIKAILFTILYTAIYIGLQFIVLLVMIFAIGIDFAFENLTLSIVLSSILAFPVYWSFVNLRKQTLSTACNFRKFDIRQIPLFILLGFFLQYLVQGIMIIFKLEEKFPEHARTMQLLFEGGSPIIIILAIVISGPFIEEILFRGLIFNELKNIMPHALAVIIQALIFGLIHGNLLQMSYAFAFGIIIGFIVIWSHSIWPAVITHISINGTPFLTSLFWESNQINQFISNNKIPVITTCGIIVIVIVYFIYRLNHTVSRTTEGSC
ncbi:MAG: CPBP family intramembrane metalloprotease [Clostridiaceae bacterium]|nr:CPBP family intramembrane metalloprotease [Clostridiaceae bacterium]